MEFGSDFHLLEFPTGGKGLLDFFPDSNLYACGRQALWDLAVARGWKRLWVPSYFCHKSLECILREGIELRKYHITPLIDPSGIIDKVPVAREDGLLVVNYFGLWGAKSFHNINCEVVEDHTHNLIGDLAMNSTADWCIASLRKTLPFADGGILWSPRHHPMPRMPRSSTITDKIMSRRLHAMTLKQRYLRGEEIPKDDFLNLFNETEEAFGSLPISFISEDSFHIVSSMDIEGWYDEKHQNWQILKEKLSGNQEFQILSPENNDDCPFAITLLFADKDVRNRIRKSLIGQSVYPAILWKIENNDDMSAKSFGDRMLSIHCDGRYTEKDIETLFFIIMNSLH